MTNKSNMYHFDVLDFFTDTNFTVSLTFTVGEDLKEVECSIISYDPIRSFVVTKPVDQDIATWIIPIKNIELIVTESL